MDPVRILAWLVIAALVLPLIIAILRALARFALHFATRGTPPARYQHWISPWGQSYYVNEVTAHSVVVSTDPNNLGGVYWWPDEWENLVRRRKLALI